MIESQGITNNIGLAGCRVGSKRQARGGKLEFLTCGMRDENTMARSGGKQELLYFARGMRGSIESLSGNGV